jgi:hypothetical protein
VKEVDKLLDDWRSWDQIVQNLADSPDFNPSTSTEAIKDGWHNLKKHEILREKTRERTGQCDCEESSRKSS